MLMFRPSWPTWVLRDDPLILPTDLAPACQSVKMPLPLWNDVHHRSRRITEQWSNLRLLDKTAAVQPLSRHDVVSGPHNSHANAELSKGT